MRITKDQAYLLFLALDEYKYEIHKEIDVKNKDVFNVMTQFAKKLQEYSKDKRRVGRTSMNTHDDKLVRFVMNYK
jgi:hypothetical protein